MIHYDTFTGGAFKEGIYPAVVTEVTAEQGKYGPQIKTVFTVENEETLEEMKIQQWIQCQISDRFPLFKQLLEASGDPVLEKGDFDEQKHVGLKIMATCAFEESTTKKNEDGSPKKYLKVVSASPLKKKK